MRELGKARALGETEGFVKVVIDRASGKLVGATIMAAHAGDMLATLTMPLHTRSGDLGPLLATTFAHPTLSEAVKVAVRDAVASAPAPEAEMTTVSSLPSSGASRAPPRRSASCCYSVSVLWSHFVSDCGERVWP